MALAADTGDKLRGLELLATAGLRIPATRFLKATPLEFPAFGSSDTVIFRPSIAYSYTAEAVQASSGLVDSLIVRSSEWEFRLDEIREMVETWPTIVQPLIPQVAGAIGHYWMDEAVIRLAIANNTAQIAQGEDAAVTGRIFLEEGAFTTEVEIILPAHLGLVDAVRGQASALTQLPRLAGWELEMCLGEEGDLYFLQAQPSSAAFEDVWT